MPTVKTQAGPTVAPQTIQPQPWSASVPEGAFDKGAKGLIVGGQRLMKASDRVDDLAYKDAKTTGPHDHGPSWAIYGQAAGETIMTDWECLARPTETTPGKARRIRDYAMKPGDAYLYEPGVLHSPRRDGPTRLLRIEGMNMDRVKRLPYQPVDAAA